MLGQMNARFIASQLSEAEEELRSLVAKVDSGEELSFEAFHVAIAHIYHHLNSAWNGRNANDQQWRECTDLDFATWQQFPRDLPLIGDDGFYDLPEYDAKT